MEFDEARYIMFAQNLTKGFYSPHEEINLWNGPGYPIILIPFIILKLPYIAITIANAFFQYFSIILLFFTIQNLTHKKNALIYATFWACYYIAFQELSLILTEPFTNLLITGVCFSFSKFLISNQKSYQLLTGFLLGYLALTKVIFAYVIIIILLIYLIITIIQKVFSSKKNTKSILTILIVSIITLIPYLGYTYTLTGKFFYLAQSGGMSLYWMSSPFQGDYGDWNDYDFKAGCLEEIQPCNSEFFEKNHRKNFEYIYQFSGVERDQKFKEFAIRNIKSNPLKYLRNCFANHGRMWFGFPHSYLFQRDRTLVRIIPNSILLTFFIFMLLFWSLNFKHLKPELHFLFLLIIIYLGGSTLVSAYPRHLYVIVPVILTLVSYSTYHSISLNLKLKNSDKI